MNKNSILVEIFNDYTTIKIINKANLNNEEDVNVYDQFEGNCSISEMWNKLVGIAEDKNIPISNIEIVLDPNT